MNEPTYEHSHAEIDAADILGGEKELVSTSYGEIQVTFLGDRKNSPCIAYPDAGLNGRTSFQSLLVASGSKSLLVHHFCIILVDLPGCESSTSHVPDTLRPLTLEKLSAQLGEVIQTLKLKECLGLGVGTGGYVLSQCALQMPKVFAGLILISPACKRAGWWEWASGKIAISQMRLLGWTASARNHFASRAFSSATLQILGGDSDLVKGFRRDVEHVPPTAAAEYLGAALYRKSIVDNIEGLKCRVLLLYGTDSPYCSDSLDFASKIDKSRFALVEFMHAGTLLTQERPAELLSPIQLFLTSLQMEGIGLGAGLIGE